MTASTCTSGAGCPSRMRRARSRSSAPSHRAITIVATALPIRFVIARASDMNRSTPSSSVSPATGIAGNAAVLPPAWTNPLPVTAARPWMSPQQRQSHILRQRQIDSSPAR